MHSVYSTSPSPTATREHGHACDETCLAAASGPETCICVCRGAAHGSQRATHGPVTPAVAARKQRDLARLLAQADDGEPF